MWRDRTNLYISYRQSYAHHPPQRNKYAAGALGSGGFASDIYNTSTSYSHSHSHSSYPSEDRRALLSSSAFDPDAINPNDAVIEMDLLPPRWSDVSDEIAELLANIATRSLRLDKLHQAHVLPGFDDDEAKRSEELHIERLTQEITRAFHQCHHAIQRIEQMVREARQPGAGGLSGAEETMARNIQVSLATKVQEASAAFRKKQSAYLKKLRDNMGGFGMPSPSPTTFDRPNSPFADPSLSESDADRSFSQSTLRVAVQQRTAALHANDAAIAHREREIEDIAQGIIELADLFRDLQGMVIDQGTLLDRIDYNVERMNTDVRGAEKELGIAQGYQRRGIKRKVMLLLLLLIAGVIILLAVKPRRA